MILLILHQNTYNNKPVLFITTIITMIFIGLNEWFDFNSYKWLILKNRVIIRPNIVLKHYHSKMRFDKTDNEEWIMKNGIECNKDGSLSNNLNTMKSVSDNGDDQL